MKKLLLLLTLCSCTPQREEVKAVELPVIEEILTLPISPEIEAQIYQRVYDPELTITILSVPPDGNLNYIIDAEVVKMRLRDCKKYHIREGLFLRLVLDNYGLDRPIFVHMIKTIRN